MGMENENLDRLFREKSGDFLVKPNEQSWFIGEWLPLL